MFVHYFKSNNASAIVFLPFIALAIWAFGFIFPVPLSHHYAMPFYELSERFVSGIPVLSTFLAMILVIAEAFLLNYIVNEHGVLSKQSYLPALFYILFMSNNNTMLVLHPLLFSNLFILFAINKLLSSYRKDKAYSQAFDGGFLISIATLFYFPAIVFFPVLGIAFILFRPFIWREWVISFIGVLVPYCFVLVYYFWNDALDYLWYEKMFYPITLEKAKSDFSSDFYFTIIITCGIIFFSVAKLFSGLSGGAQKSKKGLILLLWIFVISLLSVFIAPETSTKYFSALAIPASVFCANYFLDVKKRWWAELLLLLLLSSIFINLIGQFF